MIVIEDDAHRRPLSPRMKCPLLTILAGVVRFIGDEKLYASPHN